MTVEQQLRRLERSNRRLRIWCAGLTLVVGVGFLAGAQQEGQKNATAKVTQFDVIKAKSIVAESIVSDSINTQSVIVQDNFSQTNRFISLVADQNRVALEMVEAFNGKNSIRSRLRCTAGTGTADFTLNTRDAGSLKPNSKGAGIVMKTDDKSTTLSMLDAAGTLRVKTTVIEDGDARGSAGILLNNRDGSSHRVWASQ